MTTPAEKYLIKTVTEDLLFLKNKWDHSIDEISLRQSSNLLRTLLVDCCYLNAWRLCGFENQPRIIAPDIDNKFKGEDINNIEFAQAGGASSNGSIISNIMKTNYIKSDEEYKRDYEQSKLSSNKLYKLNEFLESTSIFFKGYFIRRREVILYVTNKLGGTHIDTKRNSNNAKEKKFIALDEYMVYGISNKLAIYQELLSIGQAIVNSRDTEKFIKKNRFN